MKPRDALIHTTVLLMLVFSGRMSRAGAHEETARTPADLEDLARELADALAIPEPVAVEIVPNNPRLVSVGFVPGRTDRFLMSFDARFLGSLDDRELRAAVAHEVGHMWIYTHFPFLQTEEGANRHAARLVPAADLDRVRQKVRESTDTPPADPDAGPS